MDERMGVWMDRWMDGYTDGWTLGRVDRWIHKWSIRLFISVDRRGDALGFIALPLYFLKQPRLWGQTVEPQLSLNWQLGARNTLRPIMSSVLLLVARELHHFCQQSSRRNKKMTQIQASSSSRSGSRSGSHPDLKVNNGSAGRALQRTHTSQSSQDSNWSWVQDTCAPVSVYR